MKQFHQHAIKKNTLLLSGDCPMKDEGELNSYIEGKIATTYYRILERRRNFTIVYIETITGRTNQIRIQFKQIGHPLIGERRFAFARDCEVKFRRVALHACSISFTHPVIGKILSYTSGLPEDMLSLYNQP